MPSIPSWLAIPAVLPSPTVTRVGRGALIGVSAGFWGGLFGVGGGIILVPAMVLFMGIAQHRAHGTSVAAIIASATASVVPYGFHGDVDWHVASLLLIGSVIGAFGGARFVSRIPDIWLARGFMLFVVAAAVRMGIGA
jgi:uncharacterized membrane protein YfcA